MMSEHSGKTYRRWEPERYQQGSYSPAAKLSEGDLVFFLLETVPRLGLSRFYAPYEKETRGAPPYHPAMMSCLLIYACRALIHAYNALNPGGIIYIRGAILDDNHLSPLEMVGFSLFYLNVFSQGGTYAEHEYRDWLTQAGFVDFERMILPDAHSFIQARKPA
jgi:hypothetical protein